MYKEKFYMISDIAEIFGISNAAAYNWINDGLKHKTKKVVGKRRYMITTIKAVEEYLGTTLEETLRVQGREIDKNFLEIKAETKPSIDTKQLPFNL